MVSEVVGSVAFFVILDRKFVSTNFPVPPIPFLAIFRRFSDVKRLSNVALNFKSLGSFCINLITTEPQTKFWIIVTFARIQIALN